MIRNNEKWIFIYVNYNDNNGNNVNNVYTYLGSNFVNSVKSTTTRSNASNALSLFSSLPALFNAIRSNVKAFDRSTPFFLLSPSNCFHADFNTPPLKPAS